MLATFRAWVLTVFKPLVVGMGKTHMPWSHKRIKNAEVKALKKLCRPGDVIVTRTEGELSDLVIPGYFKHAALVLDQDTVIEATGRGVHASDIVDFLMSKDEIALLRPLFATADESDLAAGFARMLVGRPYDYQLDPANEAYYCSEVILVAYDKATAGRSPIKLTDKLGVGVVEPESLYRDTKNFQVLFATNAVTAEKTPSPTIPRKSA
jgi:uncharacterized protein YycO